VPDDVREKIALFGDVDLEAVIPLPTVATIYEVPLVLHASGLDAYVVRELGLRVQEPQLEEWRGLVATIKQSKRAIPIALVGKYVQLKDAYISVAEALRHAAIAHGMDVDIKYVSSEELEHEDPHKLLSNVQGIVVPGGFGYRGVEGKVVAARYARERNVPYLGLCLGMQCACIYLARCLPDGMSANSTEFDPHTAMPVIDFMPDQLDITDKGGTMRLGIYPCVLEPGTRAAEAYQRDIVLERHRHRFEFNNKYRKLLEAEGFVVSGHSPDGRLVEIVELRDHPWFVASQFHPEFKSRPNRPHPLFMGFISAAQQTYPDGDQQALPLDETAHANSLLQPSYQA
jgi:CTP synthase